jgi:hypothetical protein
VRGNSFTWMGIAVSSTWSIANLWHYQQTRFPLALFAPLALFLTLAAGAADESTPIGLVVARMLLALAWLFQFRLGDDLADRQRDRRDHPDRVLTRADWRPFVGLLALLTIGNALLTFRLLPAPRGAEYLGLVVLFLLGYIATRRWQPPRLLASAGVLLKYPAFVYLLSSMSASRWTLASVLVLVYACFVAHEILHDQRLWEVTASAACLAFAMLLMTAAAILLLVLTDEAGRMWWWRAGLLGPGCIVLTWLFLRHWRRREPGLWPRAVFLVSCVWIA